MPPGIAAAKLVISLLVPDRDPAGVLTGGTLSGGGEEGLGRVLVPRRSAQGPAKTGSGNNQAVPAVCVRLPMVSRPVAVPVTAKLVIKDTMPASRLWLARPMVTSFPAA